MTLLLEKSRNYDPKDALNRPSFRPTVEEMCLVLTEPGVEFPDGELLGHDASLHGSRRAMAEAMFMLREQSVTAAGDDLLTLPDLLPKFPVKAASPFDS